MTTQAQEHYADLDRELGIAVHSAMFRKRINQTQLGAALGIGQSTVSSKLRGDTRFSIADLYMVADVLDVDLAELLPPRARRDSNPKPSDLEPVTAQPALTLVKGGLTADRRQRVARAEWLGVVS